MFKIMELQQRINNGEEVSDEEIQEVLRDVLDEANENDVSYQQELDERKNHALLVTSLIGGGFAAIIGAIYYMLQKCKNSGAQEELPMQQRKEVELKNETIDPTEVSELVSIDHF